MPKERIIGYDIIKSLAIFGVVLYHFGRVNFGSFNAEGVYYPNVSKVCYELLACSVPLFFMVNGALLADKSVGGGKILKYIILSIFYPILFYLILFPLLNLKDAPQVSWSTILLSMEFKGVYWFLFTLGVLYGINAIVKYFKIRKWLALFLLFTPFLSNQIWSIVVLFNPDITIPFWGHWGMFTLYSYLFFYFGNYLKQKCLRGFYHVSALIFLFVVGWFLLILDVFVYSNYDNVIYDGVNSSFCTLGALFLSCSVFLLVKDINHLNNSYIQKIVLLVGRNTMGIYVFHIFFIMLLRRFVLPVTVSPIVAIFLSICIIFFSCFISEILCKTPVKFLFK